MPGPRSSTRTSTRSRPLSATLRVPTVIGSDRSVSSPSPPSRWARASPALRMRLWSTWRNCPGSTSTAGSGASRSSRSASPPSSPPYSSATSPTSSFTSTGRALRTGVRAYFENAFTISFRLTTCCTMVRVSRSSDSASGPSIEPRYLWRSRSAESWIGVRGFLISWASRRATSSHAWLRWASMRRVTSSKTMTCPGPSAASAPGSTAPRHVRICRPRGPSSSTSSRQSGCAARTRAPTRSANAASRGFSRSSRWSGAPDWRSSGASRMSFAIWLNVTSRPSWPVVSTPDDRRDNTASR